ncbi:hypothetical protein [Vibrio proteolyticus]
MNPSDNPISQTEFLSRIGWIREVHPEGNRVKIDFEGNPVGQAIWSAVGRAFTYADILLAIDNQLDCRIEFMAGDISLPILVDIYSSLLAKDELVFRAKRMTIEGKEEVILRSGDAQTRLRSNNASVRTDAVYISSTAEKVQKINAKKVTLN